MRRVKIKRLSIENFKGIRQFSVDFSDDITKIVGDNGTGKTSVHDAYLWLLLGIDSENRSAFEIQPLGEDNRTVSHLTTSVTGVFDFDGVEHELRRNLNQKWTRRRGKKEDVLSGTESSFFIDGVPYKAGEFSSEISSLFCSQEDFKLISSVYAFGNLDMKSRRAKLIQMSGQMPELITPESYPSLYPYYEKFKNVQLIKDKIKDDMDKLKRKKEEIPIKISENERDLPEGIDFDAIRKDLAERQSEVEAIDAYLQKAVDGRSGMFTGISILNDQLKETAATLAEVEMMLTSQRARRVNEVSEMLSSAERNVRDIEGRIGILSRDVSDIESRIEASEKLREDLGRRWTEKNSEKYPDNIETVCPHCHRPYDEADVLELRNEAIRAFNKGKAGVLARISEEGNEVMNRISQYRKDLEVKKSELLSEKEKMEKARIVLSEPRKLMSEIPTLDNLKESSKEYQKVFSEMVSIKNRIMMDTPVESEDEISKKNRKEQLKREISRLTTELAREKDIEKVERRRSELERENVEIATTMAELESVLDEIKDYQKEYITLVESRVSSMFKIVTWKMYRENVTNDGEVEICESLVNGIPVSTNVNTAGSVNAGIDIINALSRWIGISVPLWIDGKESVIRLIETDAQIITLSVMENARLSVA